MTDLNELNEVLVISSIEKTLSEKIFDDYGVLIDNSEQYFSLYRNTGERDIQNRLKNIYELIQTGQGYFVLKGVITEYGKGNLQQVQQSYLLTNIEPILQDRIEFSGITYEVSKILTFGSIKQVFLEEVKRG